MEPLPSLRMTANLNALSHRRLDPARAAAAIRASDVAHHVLDPTSVLDLDPLAANELESALTVLAGVESDGWALGLPTPGHLLPLRGPRALNEAALEAGQVVLAQSAGLALVPLAVGRAVQWRVFAAERPLAPASPYEAERALNEAVLAAARALAELDVAGGRRPADPAGVRLAPGYGSRQVAMANRALYLLVACDHALADDGRSVSSFEVEVRMRTLREVRTAASQALCTACTWVEASP